MDLVYNCNIFMHIIFYDNVFFRKSKDNIMRPASQQVCICYHHKNEQTHFIYDIRHSYHQMLLINVTTHHKQEHPVGDPVLKY